MKPLYLLVFAGLLASSAALADDGWLGVQLQALDPDLTKALDLKDDQGVLVNEVVGDSPADKAGLKHGDVIVAFQGNPVHEVKDLTKAVRKADPGDEVTVTVLRDGKRQDWQITLGERADRKVVVMRRDGGDDDDTFTWTDKDSDDASIWTGDDGEHLKVFRTMSQGGYLGVGLQDLTEQLGKHFGVDDGKGALVSEVKPDTPAAAAGVEAGDVIVKAGDQDVASGSDLRQALADTKAGDEVTLEVVRDGHRRTLSAKVAEWPEGEGSHAVLERLHRDLPRLREFMPPEKMRELRIMRPDGDQKGLREEVEQLRKELDELRQELKNR